MDHNAHLDSSVWSSIGKLRSPSVTKTVKGTLSSRHHKDSSASLEKDKNRYSKKNQCPVKLNDFYSGSRPEPVMLVVKERWLMLLSLQTEDHGDGPG